jgi:heme/copper-type cytochrome/quinol oxidase subunit 2
MSAEDIVRYQKEAVIGREGTYYGECYELCGRNHAFMPIGIEVVSREHDRGFRWSWRQTLGAYAIQRNLALYR